MKTFLVLLLTTFSIAAQANIVVEEVSQRSFIEPACSVCAGGELVTETTFTFSAVSCANMDGNFELQFDETRRGMNGFTESTVAVAYKGAVADCFGPTSERKYSLKTTDLPKGASYIITNPTRLKLPEAQ